MSFKIYVTRDFDHMSSVAAEIVAKDIAEKQASSDEYVLGLATGNSPTGLYKKLAATFNDGAIDASRVRSFNLDEYVGLPGENVQQRVTHPESYCFFMIQEFFGHLKRKFVETNVPLGSLIDQKTLVGELKKHPGDWEYRGADAGKSIAVKRTARSKYLSWIRKEILSGYAEKIRRCGGIDLQVIGVGGRGHVAFHESGIPFRGSSVMLVKLDDDTIRNSIVDGHFESAKDCPNYAISMGAEIVYRARTVMLLANGERKVDSVTRSLLEDMTPEVPISYGQKYARDGGNLVYVLDKVAGRELLASRRVLDAKGIALEDLT